MTDDETYEKMRKTAKQDVSASATEFRAFLDWCESDEGIDSLLDKWASAKVPSRFNRGFYRWALIQLLEQAHTRGIDIAEFLPSAVLGFVTERHMDDEAEKRVIDLFVNKLR